jgi:hypothetical protein
MSKEATISKVYYDLEKGFGSIAKTLQAAKKIDPNIKRDDVKAFLDKQEHRQGKKRRGYNSFVPFAPREEFQFDLADFGASAVKYRYAFVAIDVFSKKLTVVPLESKKPEECVRALDHVIEKMGTPNYAYTDDGGEFKGPFVEGLNRLLIEQIITRSHASFAERVIRTLREGLDSRLKATNTPKTYWWKFVDPVVKQYNDTKHITTEETPNDIHNLTIEEDKEWIEELRERIAGKGRKSPNYPQISVGDHVKVLRKPGKFGERKIGFVAWSTETYRVESTEYREGVPVFYLAGRDFDDRGFRLHEILKVDGVDKPRAARVKNKQAPSVSARAPSNDTAVVRKEPVNPRRQTVDPPPRRRVRGKQADPHSSNIHPLARLITA